MKGVELLSVSRERQAINPEIMKCENKKQIAERRTERLTG